MKKLWLIIAAGLFAGEEVREGRQAAAPRRIAEPPRGLAFGNNPPLEGRQIVCQVCHSLPEAEEKANEMLRRNPMVKLIIFESISLLEIVPSDPIVKKWDDNGELGL